MAYMSFAPWESHDAGLATRSATARDAAGFTPLELRVIGIGERSDLARAVPHASRTGRFLETFIGVKLDRPLADPRLENLRRFASLASHHADAIEEADIAALVEAGFTAGQAFGLLDYFASRRRDARSTIAA